jgi:hypothetical protein
MKSAEFFLEKANEYKAAMEAVVNYEEKKDVIKDGISEFLSDPAYRKRRQDEDSLHLKIKLLFSEFVKGQYFIDEIDRINKNIMLRFGGNGRNIAVIELLDVFIEHLNEYRTKPKPEAKKYNPVL